MTTTEVRPSSPQAKARAPRGARVAGYLVAVAIDVALMWVINVAPGWRWLPFVTEDFSRVVGLVSLSLVISFLINLAYVAFDPPWAKRLGDAITAALSVVVMLQLFRIFPFDFGPAWAWLHTPFRLVLATGCVSAAIGVIANLAGMAQSLARSAR